MTQEFSVVTKRAGCPEHRRIFKTRKGAERRLALYGPEPWKAYGKGPDDVFCCDGFHCNCGGITERQRNEQRRAELPALEFARIEVRNVSAWRPA